MRRLFRTGIASILFRLRSRNSFAFRVPQAIPPMEKNMGHKNGPQSIFRTLPPLDSSPFKKMCPYSPVDYVCLFSFVHFADAWKQFILLDNRRKYQICDSRRPPVSDQWAAESRHWYLWTVRSCLCFACWHATHVHQHGSKSSFTLVPFARWNDGSLWGCST